MHPVALSNSTYTFILSNVFDVDESLDKYV